MNAQPKPSLEQPSSHKDLMLDTCTCALTHLKCSFLPPLGTYLAASSASPLKRPPRLKHAKNKSEKKKNHKRNSVGLMPALRWEACHIDFIKRAQRLKTGGLRCGPRVWSNKQLQQIVWKGGEPRTKPRVKKLRGLTPHAHRHNIFDDIFGAACTVVFRSETPPKSASQLSD